jgi:hypothetical protein
MSVQQSYNLEMARLTAGVADKIIASKTYSLGDICEFGKFVKVNNEWQVLKASADTFRTTANITTGTITMTILKRVLATGVTTTHSISVAFDTNNNTTYANLKTAIEALSNVAVDLIADGGNNRGIIIKPDAGYEFIVTEHSFPQAAQASVSQPILGVLAMRNAESPQGNYLDNVEVVSRGSIAVPCLNTYNPRDPLYIKVVGTEVQIGQLTTTNDTTTMLINLQKLEARNNNCALVLI